MRSICIDRPTNAQTTGDHRSRTRWRRLIASGLGLAAVLAAVPSVALASDGDLDGDFGTGGKVTSDFGTGAKGNAMAIQSDGKIVVVGGDDNGMTVTDFVLARYNTNGTLDNTFDTDGKVTTDFATFLDVATAVAIQSDGKIVVAGWAKSGMGMSQVDFALARYNTNGTLDNTFDTDGKVTTDFSGPGGDKVYAIAIQSDGKILVAGDDSQGFALARYNTDGTLDNTFDTDGKVTTTIGVIASALSVTIQTDGKIVAVGRGNLGSGGGNDFALARYDGTSGALDNTFDTDGIVTTDLNGTGGDTGRSVVVQSGGKIIVAGNRGTAANADFALARYDGTSGALDNTFDTDGIVTTDLNGAGVADSGNSVVLQGDGKIVVAGSSGGDFALARYDGTSGALDNTFDTNGIVTTDFNSSMSDSAYAVAIQGDGKIVAAGRGDSVFALARYSSSGGGGGDDSGGGDGGGGDDSGGGAPVRPKRTVTFDPAGGTCSENSSPWTVRFRGSYDLPTATDCERRGFVLRGWTRESSAASPEQILTRIISRSGTLYAVWGELPSTPSFVGILANFFCSDCTSAIVVWPEPSSDTTTSVVLINGTEPTCQAGGLVLGLRWCWLTGLTSGSTYTASVSWRNEFGSGVPVAVAFSLR